MRLTRLSLERYGAFTDREMRFREDARLHVVLGANEAGKSTALSAVGDLLFGFGHSTPYAFLHEMKLLRLGAEIVAADGRRLRFRRRKGNSRTLIDADDGPLPDDALAPFLGGITRSVFCRAFGLDAGALRAGGREMADVEGEVGASLFAAGSGLRGLTELQDALDARAETIFAPRQARHRTFYQALERHAAARRAIRETELRAGDWRALNDEIAAAAGALDGVRAGHERVARDRVRLERLRRARPIVAAIDALDARIAQDPDLIDADGPWIARLGGHLDATRMAEAEAVRTAAQRARARDEAAAVPVEAALLTHVEAILSAFSGIGAFEKHGRDLPRVEGEADADALALERLGARVGVAGAHALEAAQPTDAARARVEGLVRDGRALAAAEAQTTRDLADARAERDRVALMTEAEGTVRDPGPLRDALRPLVPLADTIVRHADLDAAIRREAALLRDQAGRLSPPVADTAALACAALPSAEAIARFRTLFDDKRREGERAADRCAAARALTEATRRRLREREAQGPIATRDRLEAARADREAAFAPLRDALAAGAGVAPALVAAFERAVAAADGLADAHAGDAARVAAHAADAARLSAETEAAAAAEAAHAETAAEARDLESTWTAVWAPLGIEPAPPAEMTAWRAEAEDLVEAEQALREQVMMRDGLGRRIEAARAPLDDLCARAGLDLPPGLEVGAILSGLDRAVAALAIRWESGLANAGQARATRALAARLEAALAETQARRAAWQAEWSEALAAIGLPGRAGPDEAEGALAAWQAVPDRLSHRAELLRRAAGMRRERDAFAAAAAALVAAVAPDLAGTAPEAAVRALHARLVAARERAARRAELERRREEVEDAADRAAERARIARDALAHALAERAPHLEGAPVAAIEALHGRLTAREAARDDRAALRVTLAGAAEGVAEAELRQGLDALSPEAIEADLAGLAMESDALEQRGRTIFAERAQREQRRAGLEAGTGAELAAAEREAAAADLRSAARSWSVLRIAGLMLGHALARHRAGQQDPLVARAGALFSALTGGGFAGLAQNYDEADVPRLAGRRAAGGLVAVEAMSEGTRDQLYLALRLAYLEDYAMRAEPAPFVGDDLFATFDDARTAHGLDALAAMGGVQAILFTHHRHVADLARDRLGPALDLIEL